MNDQEIAQHKSRCRAIFKAIRQHIPEARRLQASEAACETLAHLIAPKTLVLSFASAGSELNVWPLNQYLASKGQLVLPRIQGENLELFKVAYQAPLHPNQWNIWEPDPSTSVLVDPKEIDLALIPGLAFDVSNLHRLGYGKGFYDRLIAKLLPATPCYGIGFREQLTQNLPISSQDQPLSHYYCF